MGAYAEASRILSDQQIKHSSALLQNAYLDILQWNYESAEKKLNEYLKLINDDQYESRVVRLNYCASLIAQGKNENTLSILIPLLEKAKDQQETYLAFRIYLNLLQANIGLKKYIQAQNALEEAKKIIPEKSFDLNLLKKWEIVLSLEKKNEKKHWEKLKELSLKGRKEKQFELVRDCEFQLAKYSRNKYLAQKLFFGTPYIFLKKRYASLLNEYELKNFIYSFETKIKSHPLIISRENFSYDDNTLTKVGSLPHRCFLQFSHDLYRPSSLGQLFEAIYPNQFFHPIFSPLKTHQIIHRCKNIFKQKKIPLQFIENEERYFLQSRADLAIRYTVASNQFLVSGSNIIEELPLKNLDRFNIIQAQKTMKLSRRMTQYKLNKLIQEGIIISIGSGRNREYIKMK